MSLLKLPSEPEFERLRELLSKEYPFEVALPEGLPMSGVVLADHVKSADWSARRAQFVAKAPTAEVVKKYPRDNPAPFRRRLASCSLARLISTSASSNRP